jgi:hypothetical protein
MTRAGRVTRATARCKSKTLITEPGPVQIKAPPLGDASFEAEFVRERQRRFDGSTRRSWRSTAADLGVDGVGVPEARHAHTTVT